MRFSIFVLFLILSMVGKPAFPQTSSRMLFHYFELYGGMGSAHYFGEIGGASTRWPGFLGKINNLRDFDPLDSRISLSFGLRYLFNRTFAVSGQVSPIWLSGNDRGSIYVDRGWSFNTYMIEFSGQLEYYFLRPYIGFNPYVFTGFGGTARYTVSYYPNRANYRSSGNVLMAGFGFRLSNNKLWTQHAELGFRYALTDYMEMLHGSTKNNDWYCLVQYRISYHLIRRTIYNGKGMVKRRLQSKLSDWWERQ